MLPTLEPPVLYKDLVVTLDTVNRHMSHIVEKLCTAKRTKAVARARDPGCSHQMEPAVEVWPLEARRPNLDWDRGVSPDPQSAAVRAAEPARADQGRARRPEARGAFARRSTCR